MKSRIFKLDYTKEIIESDKGFIKYQGKEYFWKRCNDDLCYRELIAYEIANYLDIPSVFYNLIYIPTEAGKNTLGVVSENYKNPNLFYINGQTILKDYYYDYIKRWYRNNNYRNNYEYNNLNSIWNALDFRYRFLDNRKEIVCKLLYDIVKNLFLYDIFVENADRHFNNWEIVENIDTNEVELNKIFDNEDIFLGNNPSMNNIILTASKRKQNWYELLREFLIVSEGEYLELVLNIYNKLTPNVFVGLIKVAEKRHNIIIPEATKKELINKYIHHYAKIVLVLNEFNKPLKRILI